MPHLSGWYRPQLVLRGSRLLRLRLRGHACRLCALLAGLLDDDGLLARGAAGAVTVALLGFLLRAQLRGRAAGRFLPRLAFGQLAGFSLLARPALGQLAGLALGACLFAGLDGRFGRQALGFLFRAAFGFGATLGFAAGQALGFLPCLALLGDAALGLLAGGLLGLLARHPLGFLLRFPFGDLARHSLGDLAVAPLEVLASALLGRFARLGLESRPALRLLA